MKSEQMPQVKKQKKNKETQQKHERNNIYIFSQSGKALTTYFGEPNVFV